LPELSTTQRRAVGVLVGANVVRVLLGAALLLAPRRVLRAALGGAEPSQEALALARGFGARDIALGLGPVLGARREVRGLRGWTEAGALADLGDALAMAGWTGLRAGIRVPGLLIAAGAALAGGAGARLLPRRSA